MSPAHLLDTKCRSPHSTNYAELAAEMEDLKNNPEPPKQLKMPAVASFLDAAQLELGPPHKDHDFERAGAKLVCEFTAPLGVAKGAC